MLKYEDNPPAISIAQASSVRDVGGRWWVAHTKARFEKSFAFDLRGRGVGYFLPFTERVFVSGGRRRRTLFPLFPSYVFFCGGEAERALALATGRLCQVIPVRDQARFVEEIAALEQAVRNGAALKPHAGLAIGQRCRITGGVLENLCGVLVRQSDGAATAQVVLDVSMLGQGAVVEIDPLLLEPADERDVVVLPV